jgi:hypothetical protein
MEFPAKIFGQDRAYQNPDDWTTSMNSTQRYPERLGEPTQPCPERPGQPHCGHQDSPNRQRQHRVVCCWCGSTWQEAREALALVPHGPFIAGHGWYYTSDNYPMSASWLDQHGLGGRR